MKRFVYPFVITCICFFLFAAQTSGYTLSNGIFCVKDTFDLGFDFQAALNTVSETNNEIRLIEGTYNIVNSTTHFNIQINHSLAISGGWNTDCSLQTLNPRLSTLQGGANQVQNTGGVLAVTVWGNSSPATVSIANMTFRNGNADHDGGGLYCEHDFLGNTNALATFNISDVIAESNSTRSFCSGIAVFDWGTNGGMNANITDCIVQDNTVPGDSIGGPAGIYVDTWGAASDVTISRCQILNNTADQAGGGLYIDTAAGDAILVNNVIAGNSVKDFGGGGIYVTNTVFNTGGGNFTLTNNTITGNVTGPTGEFLNGGGIYAEFDNPSSVVEIYNNIIYDNTAVDEGDDLYIFNEGVVVNLFNNDFNSAAAGFYIEDAGDLSDGNNLNNIDPLFEDATNANAVDNDYHLTASSPVINMGNNNAPEVPPDDLEELPRPVSTAVDMGAYEYQGAPSTTTTTTLPGATTTTSTSTTSTTVPSTTTTTSTSTTSTTSTTLPGTTTTTLPATTTSTSTTTTTTTSTTSTTLPGATTSTLPATTTSTSTTTTTTSTTTTSTTSTTLPGSTTTTTVPSGGGSGGGCFIDTAAYGNTMIGNVLTLRKSSAASLALLLGIFFVIGLTREPKEH